MRRLGKAADHPNLVMGTNTQVCWHKFVRYWDIEERAVPLESNQSVTDPERAAAACDENTVGVVAVLGSTFTGEYEDIRALSLALARARHPSPPAMVHNATRPETDGRRYQVSPLMKRKVKASQLVTQRPLGTITRDIGFGKTSDFSAWRVTSAASSFSVKFMAKQLRFRIARGLPRPLGVPRSGWGR
jgi:hypothetical protein